MTREWRVMSGPKTDVQKYRVPVLLTGVGMICDPKLAFKLTWKLTPNLTPEIKLIFELILCTL